MLSVKSPLSEKTRWRMLIVKNILKSSSCARQQSDHDRSVRKDVQEVYCACGMSLVQAARNRK